MKTSTFITRILSVAIIVVLMSSNLEAQKAYHKVSLEKGITELNMMANRLIEKCKVKFDLNHSVSVSELLSAAEITAEDELNGMIGLLSENAKFDGNNTILVNEAEAENLELNLEADELMANLKFDVNQTISVSETMEEFSGLEQLTNDLMADLKFDVNQTILVTEASPENCELNQLTDSLIASNVKFVLSETNSIQDEKFEIAF